MSYEINAAEIADLHGLEFRQHGVRNFFLYVEISQYSFKVFPAMESYSLNRVVLPMLFHK